MNHLRPARLLLAALAVLIAGAAGSAVLLSPAAARPAQQQGQQGQGGPLSVGVVDYDRILNESQLRKTLDEQVKAYQAGLQAQVDQRRNEAKLLQQQLGELNAESEQARALRIQINIKAGEVQAISQAGQSEIDSIIVGTQVRIVRAMNDAAAAVAQERGLALVLRKSPAIPSLPSNLNQQQAQLVQSILAQQTLLYASPGVDITTAVLLKMDAAAKAGPATTAPAAGR